jgi:putative spermidine/putrescine transport system permease protein
VMIFLAPGLVFTVVLFLIPLLVIFYTSVSGSGLTLSFYAELVSRPLYYRVLIGTLEITTWATLLTLVIGYPVAYHLAGQTQRRRAVLIAFVLLPFWTSILVKSFAFTVVLGTQGIVNMILQNVFGMGPLPLILNRVGVVIGMTHYLLPFMIFTILSNLTAQDAVFRRAAAVMGAGPWRIFIAITWPLSLPGVLAGTTLCVILSFGMFITPALLGGEQDMMISNLIDFNIRQTLNWGVASALSMVLVAITAVLTLMLSQVKGARLLEEVQ